MEHLIDTQCDDITEQDLIGSEGILRAVVLAPVDLYLPVLPYRANGKLLFPLCKACADVMDPTKACTHTSEERSLVGSWVISELLLALQYGYKLKKVIEIWKFPFTQYDPKTKQGGLFTKYMHTFLKIKAEKSGWPPNVITDLQKAEYIKQYAEKDGIILDENEIEVNNSKRSLAKLGANSLWGKLSQKENNSNTTVCLNAAQLYDILSSPLVSVDYIFSYGEEAVWVNWRHVDTNEDTHTSDFKRGNNQQSVIVGCFVTAYARIKLYKELVQIGRNLLYCDTDSCVFVKDKNLKYEPVMDDAIGSLSDELACYGRNAFISEFCCIGPKSYSYRVKKSHADTEFIEVTKCKGFVATNENVKHINFDTFKSFVTGNDNMDDDECLYTCNKRIKLHKNLNLATITEKKRLAFTFIKRIGLSNGDSVPYGYKMLKNI